MENCTQMNDLNNYYGSPGSSTLKTDSDLNEHYRSK